MIDLSEEEAAEPVQEGDPLAESIFERDLKR